MAAAPGYQRGFADGQREAARIVLDTLADAHATATGRLASFPDVVAAVNEATAILRDAARALDFDPETTRAQAERPDAASKPRPHGGGEVAVARRRDASPGLAEQEAPA